LKSGQCAAVGAICCIISRSILLRAHADAIGGQQPDQAQRRLILCFPENQAALFSGLSRTFRPSQ
jgi:hypothetical protein